MLVADEDGLVVGLTACGETRDVGAGPEVGEVRTLFVAPRRWRGGVGRALIQAALADLRRRGKAQATVWSFDANERANRFYETQGFTRDGAERTEAAWNHLLEVRYRRGLA